MFTPSSKVIGLLEKAKSFSELEQRQISAILGGCVADAAARPLHWVYDMSDLKRYLNDKDGTTPEEKSIDRNKFPEFYPESRSPFYSLPTGENSCYFDISRSILYSLRDNKGVYDYEVINNNLKEDFFVKPEYNFNKRMEYMSRRARGFELTPIEGKWLSGSLIDWKQNFLLKKRPYGGSKIKETDGFCASAPLVAAFPSHPELRGRTLEIVQTFSTWPTSVSHGQVAARILQAFVLNKADPVASVMKEIPNEFPDVHQSLEEVYQNLDEDHVRVVGWVFGRPCYNPGSFQGALHALLSSESFGEAVRKTIRAGGCCCSRSFFIGCCAGAKYGLDGIPLDWIARSTQAEAVLEAAIEVVTTAK